ncbi:MAG TPA: PQQ-binding-like beta-propeller repeat protein, partial [Sumerlaeia bacterium]|nr:PQQ-binding-like beta-propeller repeat protein [Sumerlaeia bacterium]
PQGYLMASGTRLYVPMGRTSPAIIDRANGELLGRAPGPGGAYALLLEDTFAQGPGRATGEIHLSNAATQESLASFPGAVGIVLARGGMAYLYTRTEISALDRERYVRLKKDADQLRAREGEIAKKLKEAKEQSESAEPEKLGIVLASVQESLAEKTEAMKACYLWKKEIETPFTAILAGKRLYVGFDGRTAAFDTATGGEVWSAAVSGRAYGLAAADGRLFVSADGGTIQCFSGKSSSPTVDVAAKGAGDEKASGLPPYAEDKWTPLYRQAATDAVEALRTRKGYCLVLGCGEGRLAYEIARISDLRVVGVESDPAKAAAARKALDKAGLYGVRVAVHEGPLTSLPYPPHFANLIVSDRALVAGDLPPSPEEARRALRPEGGTLYLVLPKDLSSSSQATSSSKDASGEPSASRSPADTADDALSPWFETFREMKPEIRRGTDTVTLVARRGRLPGSGEWTHPYADPGNTASSRDDLFAHPVRVQWFGEPGPREIVDRHNRPMASLYGNGRLFVPARDKVIAVDAYNGAALWEAVIPHSTRVAINRDIGYMALADDYLYVAAAGKCVGLDVASGERRLDFAAPQVVANRESDWGYIAVVGDRVFGSGQAPGASLKTPGLAPISEAAYYDFRPLVTSDYLFSLDRRSGQEIWRYRGGVIPNSGVALGDGGIYFFESRNPEAAADQTGRLRLSVLCAQGRGHIVKLDAETGGKLWERQVDLPFDHVLFLSYNNGALLATGSRNHEQKLWYEFRAFNPGDGSLKWKNRFVYGTTLDGGHGEQDQHPAIVGNRIYARPFDLDLQTGAQGAFTLDRGGHGCGGITASAKYLFGRGGNPQMVEIAAGGGSPMPLTRVTRPGCYLNMIAAGGLLLAPESSSGCTCDYAVQTSMAFAPVALSAEETFRQTPVRE